MSQQAFDRLAASTVTSPASYAVHCNLIDSGVVAQGVTYSYLLMDENETENRYVRYLDAYGNGLGGGWVCPQDLAQLVEYGIIPFEDAD